MAAFFAKFCASTVWLAALTANRIQRSAALVAKSRVIAGFNVAMGANHGTHVRMSVVSSRPVTDITDWTN
ncbi:MAG TPA: hypothetical protein VK603_14670, partial [Candidatus Saccharimonadales bacterium]|nr:hypothetical protein [Candidatus Saccharimonadales bacterium]